ncbi:MAG: adenosylmethionine decarboxylase [Saprospiraceae bacterium]
MKYSGTHYISELYKSPADFLSDPTFIAKQMNAAAIEMEASIVNSNFHHFNPYGVSGVIIIKESHLTIHTWPEYGYAAIDIFTCGKIYMDKGIDYLSKNLKAKTSVVKKLGRGAVEKFTKEFEGNVKQ